MEKTRTNLMICYAMSDSNSRKERLACSKTIESKIPVITVN